MMALDESEAGSSRRRRNTEVNVLDSDSEETPRRTSRSNGHGNGNGNGNGGSPAKRRRVEAAALNSDVDSDQDSQANGREEARASRKGKGRASTNANGNGHLNGSQDEGPQNGEDEDAEETATALQYHPEYERHADGFVTGAITRIKLRDFMTYDFVEFRPGPHLNMILGPNGTGKSTIAAGIAIGLGFKPEVMGRAPDLKSYVKQGKEEAWTEIEVRGKKGKRNYVIWRKFTRGEKSEWKLNGQPATRKAVLELVGTFGIQANNLCCFLAQDRVAEFAKMSPPLTLKETMRAAGNPRLSEWHQALVTKGGEKKVLDEKVTGDVTRRDQLQAQVDSLAPDVEHFENRQNKEFHRELMELAVGFAKATELKEAVQEAQDRVKEIKDRVKLVDTQNKPLEDLYLVYENKQAKATAKLSKVTDEAQDATRQTTAQYRTLVDKIDETGKADDELVRLRQRIKRQADAKQRLLEKKAAAEQTLAEPREEIVSRLNEQQGLKKECYTKRRAAEQERRDFRDRRHNLETDIANIGRGIDDKMRRKTQLSDVERVRTENAIAQNGSIGFVLDWLKEHGHELEHEVGLPPAISVNVTDPKYAWQVEQSLDYGKRSTFICQSKRDYDTLTRLTHTRYPDRILSNGTRVNGGTVKLYLVNLTPTQQNVDPRPLCTPNQLRDLGLDGCANQFVQAKPVVMAFLNEHCGFNRTAFTHRPASELDSKAITAAGIASWLTRDESFRAQQSRYGRREFQITTQPGRPAQLFNQRVDEVAIAQLAEEIAELKRRQRDSEKPLQDLNEDLAKLEKRHSAVQKAEEDVESEIKLIKTELSKYDGAQTSLALAEQELKKIEEMPSETEQRARLVSQKLEKALSCLSNVTELADLHQAVGAKASDSVSARILDTECTLNLKAITKKRDASNKEKERLLKEREKLVENQRRLAAKANDSYERFRTELAERSLPVRKEFGIRAKDPQHGNMSVEDAQAALARVTAELDISEGISPDIIQRYKRLSAELEKVQTEVSHQEEDLRKVNKSIEIILGKFVPALDSLVNTISKKFSIAFDRNNCSGDVRLDKDERGYEYWGLVPHVSFRDGEDMQPLTGHRQSGGERSYSTIMFLMALSEMARVPFSLVDEINQGMDQQAERTVFNQLVETTCQSDAGQYFLITPKLLTGLKYHERMKVLIVNNGYWLPEGTDKKQKFGDLSTCLKRYKTSIGAH